MNFTEFKYSSSGAGTIWVTANDTTNNLKFLQKETELRIKGKDPTTCILQSEGICLNAVALNDQSRYFSFNSFPVKDVANDGNLHLCFIKDMDISDIHHIKVELVVTFHEEDCNTEEDIDDNFESTYSSHEICLSSSRPKAMIFDTETSGLTSGFNVILQLSYQIVDLTNWEIIKEVNHFFNWPDEDYKVEPEAIFVNGLSQEFLEDQILSDKSDALFEFFDDLEECDLAIAHNLGFDKDFIIEDSLEEYVIFDSDEKEWPICIDTMVDTTDFCKLLPKKNGEYKWPKLSELASKLSVKSYDLKLHDSRSDVELTKRCFRQLCEIGFYKLNLERVSQGSSKSFASLKNATFLSSVIEEINNVEKSISTDSSCLKTFKLPIPSGLGNRVHLDYGIDSRFEKCKDVLNYISPLAYSYVREQKGSYEAKYTFQNMKDRISSEIDSLSTYRINKDSIQSTEQVIDICGSTLSALGKIVASFETIINDRFSTYYGQPGEPSDFKGLYAVADFYAQLSAIVYKLYLSFEQLNAPDQYSKKLFENFASICFNLYYQAKSYPKESLDKILDIESNPRVRGTIDLGCHLSVDKSLSDEIADTLKLYEKSMRDGSIRL